MEKYHLLPVLMVRQRQHNMTPLVVLQQLQDRRIHLQVQQ